MGNKTKIQPLRLRIISRIFGKRFGFTLMEVILTLALIMLVGAALVPLFNLMFGIHTDSADLSQAQTIAGTQLTLIEQRLRYATSLRIEQTLPEFTQTHSYLYSENGTLRVKQPEVDPAPLNTDLSPDGYTYGINFSVEEGSLVLRVDLTVYQRGSPVHRIHSNIYSENLSGQDIMGAKLGTVIIFTPPGPQVAEITLTAEPPIVTNLSQQVQMSAVISPAHAENRSVVWSIDDSDYADITPTGLLTPKKVGSVKVIAKATDGSGIKGELTILIGS